MSGTFSHILDGVILVFQDWRVLDPKVPIWLSDPKIEVQILNRSRVKGVQFLKDHRLKKGYNVSLTHAMEYSLHLLIQSNKILSFGEIRFTIRNAIINAVREMRDSETFIEWDMDPEGFMR